MCALEATGLKMAASSSCENEQMKLLNSNIPPFFETETRVFKFRQKQAIEAIARFQNTTPFQNLLGMVVFRLIVSSPYKITSSEIFGSLYCVQLWVNRMTPFKQHPQLAVIILYILV